MLPSPWEAFSRSVRPRGGQVVTVIAAPGVGKTMFGINWSVRSEVTTLYASADTDAQLFTLQLACLATGHERELVERRLAFQPRWRDAYRDAIRLRFPHLATDFSSAPDMTSLGHQAEALTEVWGQPPHLVVLDTASDVKRGKDDFAGWQELWQQARDFSRFFNCVVMFMHHVTQGPAASGDKPLAQSDGMYKADQFAEVLIGLYRGKGTDSLQVQVLKNRGGRSRVTFPMHVDYARALISEVTWSG